MKMRPRRALLALAVLVASAGSAVPVRALPGDTRRVSVGYGGRQANGPTPATSVADTSSPAFGLAGLHVAFSSDASNLVPGDTNGVADVFFRDLVRKRTSRISVSSSGRQANGPSHSPAVSVDGRFVAFVSEASNLVGGDTNGVADIFLRDMRSGSVRRVSVSSSGAQANAASSSPTVSLFARWIGFDSEATNLHGRDANGMPDAFVHDRGTRRTVRIAAPRLAQAEPKPNDIAWTSRPTVSYDGEWIAFQRLAARLVPAQTPLPDDVEQVDPRLRRPGMMSRMDVYMLHRRSGRVKRILLTPWTTTSAAYRQFVAEPTISADGKYVVMTAWSVMDNERATGEIQLSEDLIVEHPIDQLDDDGYVRNPLDHKDVWIYDRVTKTGFPVSRSSVGFMGNGDSFAPQISSQGHAVAFASEADNLTVGDRNDATDIFVWDSRERSTSRVSVGPGFSEAAAAAIRPSMSYEGRSVTFASTATNLAASDTNGASDIFWHDRRIDVPDTAPLLPGQKKVRTIEPGQTFRMTFRGTDAERDPLRYGLLLTAPPPPPHAAMSVPVAVPDGATLDPVTGVFEWTPRPDQAGPWIFVVWVGEPRGRVQPPPLVGPKNRQSYCQTCAGTFVFARFVVRTVAQTVQCRVEDC